MSLLENVQSPWMNEELLIQRDAVRKFIEREFAPHARKWDKQGYVDRDAWLKAGRAGVLLASIDDRWGGGGGDFRHEMVIIEELSRANVTGIGNSVHSGIVAHYINSYGTEEQKQRWLPKMATGELVAAIAMSEPGTGSDLQAVATTAVRDGDHYVINGQKTFITNGMTADLVCVVAKTDPNANAKGVSLLMVEVSDGVKIEDTNKEGKGEDKRKVSEGSGEGKASDPTGAGDTIPGFKRGRNLEKLGLKAQDTAELFFDEVRVPTSSLLGTSEGNGFTQLMQQLPQERLIIAVGACAAMETALRLTSEYVKERKAFGKRLLDFQNTQFKLAECMTEARIARTFVDDCAMKLLDGKLDTATAAMAKWWTAQKQCEIVDTCLQFFGGYGYMMEYPIAKMYLDSRVQKIYGGSNEIMKMLIAREI